MNFDQPRSWISSSRFVYPALLFAVVLIFFWRAVLAPLGWVIVGWDIREAFYPWLTYAKEALMKGHIPLWDLHYFGGIPFAANPQNALYYPFTWLILLYPSVGFNWHVILHVWLSGLGMLLLVRGLSQNWEGAFLASLTFSFSGFMTARIWAGHITLIAVYAWVPWLLLASWWSVRSGSIRSATIAGLPLGLALLAGHPTSLLYLGIAWLGFAIFMGTETLNWILVARQVLISAITGLAISAVQLLPFVEFARLAVWSSSESSLVGSMPPVQLITLIIPGFFGSPFGEFRGTLNYHELMIYAGILPLLGIVIALRKPTRLVWFYIGLAILGLWMALGTYGLLTPLLYWLLPFTRSARIPARAGFLFVFAGSALLGEGIAIWKRRPPHNELYDLMTLLRKVVKLGFVAGMSGIITTSIFFLILSPGSVSVEWITNNLLAWIFALALLLVGGTLLARYLNASSVPHREFQHMLALSTIVILDLWGLGFRYIMLASPVEHNPWEQAQPFILNRDLRVLPWEMPLAIQNWAALSGMMNVDGYNPIRLRAQENLLSFRNDPRNAAYDIYSTGYVISYRPLHEYQNGDHPLTLLGTTEDLWVYQRDRILELARLVYDFEVILSSEAAIARVHASDFDPTTTAILSAEPPCEIGPAPDAPGAARIVEAQEGHWLIETQNDAPALLILSETAYPGWQVSIDGEPAQPLAAYTVIKAVCVPAGTHHVEWTYPGSIYWLGGGVSIAALAAIIMAGVANRRRRTTAAGATAAEENRSDERLQISS